MAPYNFLRLDEMSGDIAEDSSTYDRIGQLINAPTWSSDYSGGAIELDGTDEYVEILGYKGIFGTGSRTCCVLNKTSQVSGEILTCGEDNPDGPWGIRVNEDGQIRVEVPGGGITGTTLINDDDWYHVAVELEDDGDPIIGETKLYVEGTMDTNSAADTKPVNTGRYQNVQVGMYYVTERYINGLIDDVRIYDRVLTDHEISEF